MASDDIVSRFICISFEAEAGVSARSLLVNESARR